MASLPRCSRAAVFGVVCGCCLMGCAATTTIREALEDGEALWALTREAEVEGALSALEQLVEAAQDVERLSDSFRNGKGAEWADVDDARRRYLNALDAVAAVGPGQETT